MALPPAPKDISDHPIPGSVIDPVNKQAKEADVDRKIRLYGVIEAFHLGRLPTNEQIDETLKYVLDHPPVERENLSPDGKKLVQDTHDIIETARLMVKGKNADELFQQFVWHTRDIDRNIVKTNVPETVEHQTPEPESRQAVRHLRTLLSLVLTNSEVRKLLSDFSIIGRDLLSRGLKKVSEEIAPTKEELTGTDAAAPQNEFVTEGGHKVGPEETPVLEARVPGTETTVKQHPKEGGAKIGGEREKERDLGEAIEAASEGKEKVKKHVEEEIEGHTRSVSGDDNAALWMRNKLAAMDGPEGGQDVGVSSMDGGRDASRKGEAPRPSESDGGRGHLEDIQDRVGGHAESEKETEKPEQEVEKKQGRFIGKMKGFRDAITDRVPQEHHDAVEKGRKFVMEEYFPQERREQFIFRGKKVIIECQKHDDYQESLCWLLSYIEYYAKRGRHVATEGREGAKEVMEDRQLHRSVKEIRTLLERFANNHSMDGIIDAFYVLSDDAMRDKELKDWFKDVNAYIRRVLLEAGYVLEQGCNHQAGALRKSGRRFYDVKYKEHFDTMFDSIGKWFQAMGDDPLNKRFGEDWARLTRDLLFDSEGSLKFKKSLWNDVRKIVVPQLVDKVGYIPIPRIEYTDEGLDLVVENLTLSGRNIFPNIVSIEAHNFVKFSPYEAIGDESHHTFTFTLGQMQADMRDVMFYFKKKSGMVRLSDSGLADVVMGGEGMTTTIVLVSAGKDRSSVFKVHDVHVKVASLKFSIRDSKHDLLYKTLRPLATGLVKRQIQRAFADAMRTGLEYVDEQLVKVRRRMEEAKEDDEKSRTQVLQEIFARKSEATSTQSRTSTLGTERHFKVVSNKRDSLLSNAGNPAGWVSRTAEKDEEAKRGEEWRSDAFTIVR